MFLEAIILGSVLLWSPPDGKAPDGYIVYAGEGSRAYESSIDVGLDTTFVLDGYFLDGRVFFLSVTAYNRYGESSFANEVVYLVSSIGDDGLVSTIKRMRLYPNPFNSETSIKAESRSKVEIFNVLGRKLRTMIIEKGKTTLDMRNMSSGIYLFRFQVIGSKQWCVMRGIKI